MEGQGKGKGGQLAFLERQRERGDGRRGEVGGCLLPEQTGGESEVGGGAESEASRWTSANNRGGQMQPQRTATTQ